MSRQRLGEMLLIGVFLVVGALAWYLRLEPTLRVDDAPLASLSHQLGPWQGVDLPLDSGVEAILRADFNLQRAYQHTFGDIVWLYIGYYGTERGGTPEHTPAACYRAQGWRIEERRTLAVAPEQGLHVNEYVVEKDGRRDLIHFWFRSHRRTGILGNWDRMVDHLLGRLLDRRADGALVRVSAVLDGDVHDVRSRLVDLAVRIDEALDTHWPAEIPIDEPGTAERSVTTLR